MGCGGAEAWIWSPILRGPDARPGLLQAQPVSAASWLLQRWHQAGATQALHTLGTGPRLKSSGAATCEPLPLTQRQLESPLCWEISGRASCSPDGTLPPPRPQTEGPAGPDLMGCVTSGALTLTPRNGLHSTHLELARGLWGQGPRGLVGLQGYHARLEHTPNDSFSLLLLGPQSWEEEKRWGPPPPPRASPFSGFLRRWGCQVGVGTGPGRPVLRTPDGRAASLGVQGVRVTPGRESGLWVRSPVWAGWCMCVCVPQGCAPVHQGVSVHTCV